MRRLCIFALSCLAIGCLDVGAEQSVQTAHRSLQKGMMLQEVLFHVETASDAEDAWILTITDCQTSSSEFAISFSKERRLYVLDETRREVPGGAAHQLQLFSNRADLLQVLNEERLRSCRLLRADFSRLWYLELNLDTLGRVARISSPIFGG